MSSPQITWDTPQQNAAVPQIVWDKPAPPSAASRLGTNFLSGLGVTSNEQAKNFFAHPLDTVIKSFEAQGELAAKAREAYKRGDYMEALQHGLNYLVPFLGQQTDVAGTQLKEGDIAGGVGRTLGAAVPIVAGSPDVQAGAGAAASAAGETAAKGIRAGARGANTALAKYPKAVGTAAGGAIGAATHMPYGAEVGAGIGAAVGPEILPKIRIPGEGFGFPSRVTGGPRAGMVPLSAMSGDQPIVATESPAPAPTAPASPIKPYSVMNESAGEVFDKNVPLYHGTAADLVPQILKNGLVPRALKGSEIPQVFLRQTPEYALEFAARKVGESVDNDRAVIVTKPGVQGKYMPGFHEGTIFADRISPSQIERVDFYHMGETQPFHSMEPGEPMPDIRSGASSTPRRFTEEVTPEPNAPAWTGNLEERLAANMNKIQVKEARAAWKARVKAAQAKADAGDYTDIINLSAEQAARAKKGASPSTP